MTAVLLVFQYGQPRIFFAMARDGLPAMGRGSIRSIGFRTSRPSSRNRRRHSQRSSAMRPRPTTSRTSEPFAFAIVCVGVLVLRYTDPGVPGRFVPFVVGRRVARHPRDACSSCRVCRGRRGSAFSGSRSVWCGISTGTGTVASGLTRPLRRNDSDRMNPLRERRFPDRGPWRTTGLQARRTRPQPQEYRRRSFPQQARRHHGSLRIGQVVARLRHDLRRRSAALRRIPVRHASFSSRWRSRTST